jgi:hypothetical protein
MSNLYGGRFSINLGPYFSTTNKYNPIIAIGLNGFDINSQSLTRLSEENNCCE